MECLLKAMRQYGAKAIWGRKPCVERVLRMQCQAEIARKACPTWVLGRLQLLAEGGKPCGTWDCRVLNGKLLKWKASQVESCPWLRLD